MGIPSFLPDTKLCALPSAVGSFKDGSPCGVTIHYTADDNVKRVMESLVKNNLGYHVIISRTGTILQTLPFSSTCYHAGKAKWLGKSPNRHHIAIAIAGWGLLTRKQDRFFNWAKGEVPAKHVAFRRDNIKRELQPWHAASPQQIQSLMYILRWCVFAHGMDSDSICGHDECALPVGRKVDPGGTLPWSMQELRDTLHREKRQKR